MPILRRFDQTSINWHRIGVAFSACIIAFAMVVLYRALRGIDSDKVLHAIQATEGWRIAVAVFAIAASYLTFTFYDFFALRTLGYVTIPYRVAARAAIASFSIGHCSGGATLFGAGVSYRFYTPIGCGAIAVARMCFLVALTFWLGNAAAIGICFTLEPATAAAIDRLPPIANVLTGVFVLGMLAIYLYWVWRTPRHIGRSGWIVRLPDGPSTLLQIAIGILDLACSAVAMYVLLPSTPSITFAALAVAFVLAMLLGFGSNTPGGLGVFDATMLLALPQFGTEALLAALLLFRLLYYLLPLGAGLMLLGARELAGQQQRSASSRCR